MYIMFLNLKNLFSVRQINKAGYFVLFGDNMVIILDRNDQVIATGVIENDLYRVNFCLNNVIESHNAMTGQHELCISVSRI